MLVYGIYNLYTSRGKLCLPAYETNCSKQDSNQIKEAKGELTVEEEVDTCSMATLYRL